VVQSRTPEDEELDDSPLVLQIPEQAKKMSPDKVYLVGEKLLMEGKSMEAAGWLYRAAEMMPRDPFSQGNLAIALHQMGRSKDAVIYFRAAASLDPQDLYFANLGQALWSIGEIDEAIRVLRTAVRLNEDHVGSLVLLMQLEHYTCNVLDAWDTKVTQTRKALRRAIEAAEQGGGVAAAAWTPSQVLLLDVEEELVRRLCAVFTADAARLAAPPFPLANRPRVTGGRLRIGYVSYSFGLGVRNGLMYNVFSSHDRGRVEVFGFAIRPHDPGADEAEQKRVEANVEHFVDISRVPVEDTALLINSFQVHVLVDICGLHANGTLIYRVFARQPARVQVAYMAFAGTTGAGYMELLATDRHTSPPEYSAQYAEGLLFLPHSYHVNSHRTRFPTVGNGDHVGSVSSGERRRAREEAGLPGDALIVTSFNQFFKIDKHLIHAWAGLLEREASAVVVLIQFLFHQQVLPRLRRELEKRGVRGERLLMVDKLPAAQHLNRSRLFDLHLDTKLQSGHTTTVDALWGGLPVLVWPARSLVSRAAVGIVSAAGLPWAIARTGSDYVALAQKLVGGRGAAASRAAVQESKRGSPLFDLPLWVRHWERALRTAADAAATRDTPGAWHVITASAVPDFRAPLRLLAPAA